MESGKEFYKDTKPYGRNPIRYSMDNEPIKRNVRIVYKREYKENDN